jgi:tetratricopeptide (TPR) repeat protein
MLQARYNLGNALAACGAHAEAIAAFDEVLAAAPDFLDARNNRGRARLAHGDAEGARADFDGVLAQDPRHLAALANRGAALLAADRLEEAVGASRCRPAAGSRTRLRPSVPRSSDRPAGSKPGASGRTRVAIPAT